MALEHKIIPGELPQFWNRGIIFFANIHSLFFGNKRQTDILTSELGSLSSYGGRLLPILSLLYQQNDSNLIFLESPPDASLIKYMTERLGLSLPETEILTHRDYLLLKEKIGSNHLDEAEPLIRKVKDLGMEWLDGFVTDPTLLAIAKITEKQTVSSMDGSKNGNNKLLLHHHLVEKGLPVFDTQEASSPNDILSFFNVLKDRGYRKAVVKSQIGASGYGLVKCDLSSASKETFSDYLFFEGSCLVQGWLDEEVKGIRRIGSPSVQMFLRDTELTLFDITEQFLREDSVHEGNISPPSYLNDQPEIRDELLSQALESGKWLHQQGYRGTASTDFLVIERMGQLAIHVCEINARVTGATYPSVLSHHFLPHGAWVMRNLRFTPPLRGFQLLNELDQHGLLFEQGMKTGILPFNFNTDALGNVHKGQFIFLSPEPEECQKLLDQMQIIFPLICKYDRD